VVCKTEPVFFFFFSLFVLAAAVSEPAPLCHFEHKVPMESTWAAMQAEIDAQPMPPPSESGCPATVSVHCNDCGLDSSPVPFHFLGCRCSTCGSFNTAISSSSSEDQSPEERDPGEEEEE
jgi:hypothetical protein